MHNSKLKKITVALCMALAPVAVFSAGLGKLNVSSGLGEPLRADIELLSVTPDELSNIFAVIASEEAYATQGIERPASHSTIKVEVSKNARGTPILKLKSTQPISEPFLDMLIQVDWASGRLLREYTVLLDPPGYVGEEESTTTQLPAVKPSSTSSQDSMVDSSSAKASSTTNKPKQIKKAPIAADSANATNNAPNEEYQTRRGDSLAKVARDYKPEGISLDQMLVGLYQANPNAFDGKNMNRLKVGKILRLPSEQELASLSRQQASKEVKVQSANWNEYRNKLAGIVAESAPSESEASTQSADGKIKSAAEDKSAPAATGPKDVVKLSAGDAALTKKEADDVKNLQAKITALQEESTAREKSVMEAKEKTAALEKQIADMQQLLALKNGTMSELQKQAQAQAEIDKNASNTAPPAVSEQPQPSEMAPPEPIPAAVQPPAPIVAEATPPAQPKPSAVVVTDPAVDASFLDSLDLPLVGSAAGVLALLGGGWMYLRNKRKRNLADFEQGIMTSGGLKANTVFGNTSGSSVDTGDTSFLTDFSQSANGGMIDTNDVDPIAEAEVYMAYGRDAQAEEILKDAISKEPKRYELHLKLLEMYAASKNVSAFETIAGELYTTLGAEDPTWAKVAEIGQNLEPSNPLYQANTTHSTSAHSSAGQSNVAQAAGNVLSEKLEANDFSDSPIASETDLDFTFDNDSLVQNFESASSEKDAFDLELDALATQNPDEINFTNNDSGTASLTADTVQSFVKPELIEEIAPVTKSAVAESIDALDFDFGDLTSATETTAENNNVDFGHTMPGLDMSNFESTKTEPEFTVDTSANVEISDATDVPQLGDLNLNEPTFAHINDISFVKADATAEETNFNFDLSALSNDAPSYVDDNTATANTYDLSGINLDMTDATSTQDLSAFEVVESNENEPIEIETKLDLVAAYIEMDDAEGAKELLDEVMKEGGATQRKRAEALLAKLV